MLIIHNREKLINTIIYFATNVEKCGKIKLFKLLYFLDFEHCKHTGRSVTGLDYYAWKMGPVPTKLYDEIQSPEPDMATALRFGEMAVYGGRSTMMTIHTKRGFDDKHFSRRELALMKQLAEQYKDSLAEEMIEATHLENSPWYKVYEIDGDKQGRIPYELALRQGELDTMLSHIAERKALIGALS
ncbi:Panacea domain-containing protein [Moraxella bovis]|uniref:Uncharacterized phage-associated protein n=1 Tax=Moraxella bovis TaxID=476 RepID=A0A378PYT1_MORBO|nr:Panacea domain-containing protein [Moraxella bovis]STY93446.1 Uncharacterized phage-associated protein [Moraxella bovis]